MTQETVRIPVADEYIEGELAIPKEAKALIVFAHGSGSSRFSPRNQFVARFLQKSHFATLLIDLLTPKEESYDQLTREIRFNIDLLSTRLLLIVNWLEHSPHKHFPVGYFGSSTGAAGALIAAAKKSEPIFAIVSRGGRPDLAKNYLAQVKAPTLFIVGGEDFGVIELNKQAYDVLTSPKSFKIIPGATHLFEEPGALESVSSYASEWFSEKIR